LTGAEANHGEDVKEYWWYLDAVPSHVWNSWRYHTRSGPTHINNCSMRTGGAQAGSRVRVARHGTFDDDRYWSSTSSTPRRIRPTSYDISVTNAGPDTELLHVLPTMWYRTPGPGTPMEPDDDHGHIDRDRGHQPSVPRSTRAVSGTDPQGAYPELLFCDNDTNLDRSMGSVFLTMAEGRHQRPRCLGRRHRQFRSDAAPKCAAWYG